jgi:hypothetical protein
VGTRRPRRTEYYWLLMSNLNLELLEISDEQALAAVESVTSHLTGVGFQNLSFECMILDSEPAKSWSADEFRGGMTTVLGEHGFFFRRLIAIAQVPGNNPNNMGSARVEFSRQAGGTATASISLDGQADRDPGKRTGIGLAFNKAFEPFHRRKIFAQFPTEIADFYTRRESTLLRLEEVATRAAENSEAHRRKLDDLFEERRAKLEVEYQGRDQQLQAEFDERLRSLDEKEKALLQREADLERADNTHARRKLHHELKNALKERHTKFTLTAETENKRRPVFWTFLALMAATFLASVCFGVLAFSGTAPQGPLAWLPSLRLALSVAAFAAATVYFIRWQDRWSQIHADEEFRLKRLDLDVDRASWLVEVLLEWRAVEGGGIPDDLIGRLANGLFDPGRPYPSATHPVEDAIATLLGSPASVKLKLPGGELNLDKRSIDRAKSAGDP